MQKSDLYKNEDLTFKLIKPMKFIVIFLNLIY